MVHHLHRDIQRQDFIFLNRPRRPLLALAHGPARAGKRGPELDDRVGQFFLRRVEDDGDVKDQPQFTPVEDAQGGLRNFLDDRKDLVLMAKEVEKYVLVGVRPVRGAAGRAGHRHVSEPTAPRPEAPRSVGRVCVLAWVVEFNEAVKVRLIDLVLGELLMGPRQKARVADKYRPWWTEKKKKKRITALE